MKTYIANMWKIDEMVRPAKNNESETVIEPPYRVCRDASEMVAVTDALAEGTESVPSSTWQLTIASDYNSTAFNSFLFVVGYTYVHTGAHTYT